MIYKFTFSCEEGDPTFRRVFEASADATFLELHEAILKSVGYPDDQMTSFFLCNDEWENDEIFIEEEDVDLDGLNYLAGKSVDFINKSAMKGTLIAHTDGNVPNLMVNIPEKNEYYLGQLFYFFEFACGVSGYMLGVNPFDQPGVESYKSNMFALLGKPGYEEQRKELQKRLKTQEK